MSKYYTFIVGESTQGEIEQSIIDCPHLLMGGSTGMGKSTAFKLMLYTLLARTPHDLIKFTLLDLKRGVEVKDFEGFPNVTIAKNESDSVDELKKVVQEMDKRYKFLEKNNRKKINPERDGRPLIIVAVDEASVIFGAKSASSKLKELTGEARELCEKIAKLGRAAGIHMILATQRATKTSIDTSTLDNLEARLCFRTRSVSGSNALLGDKSGSELPNIPGRAIWQIGAEATTVQVHYMPEDEFSEMCEELKVERIREFGDPEEIAKNSDVQEVSAYKNSDNQDADV